MNQRSQLLPVMLRDQVDLGVKLAETHFKKLPTYFKILSK